jgi:hypothetical protein
LKTSGERVVGNSGSEHNHECNSADVAARQAVSAMYEEVTNVSSTSSVATGAVAANLSNDVLMALPKRASLKQRHYKGVVMLH